MKKLALSLVLLFTIVLSAKAIHPEKWIAQLSKEQDVSIETIDTETIGQAMDDILEGLETMHVIMLEGCSADILKRYTSLLNQIEDTDGYETILQVKDDEDNVRIMLKKENDTIQGLYVFVVDDEDVVAVKLLGNLSQLAIDKLLEEHSEKN